MAILKEVYCLKPIHALKRPKGEKLNLEGTFQDCAVIKPWIV